MKTEIEYIHLFYIKIIEILKKYEAEQKNPIETARKIYKTKGEVHIISAIFILNSHFFKNILNKKYNQENFEWYFNFLEEAYKLIGADECAYWARKDFKKCLNSWIKYGKERNKGKPQLVLKLEYKISNNNNEK